MGSQVPSRLRRTQGSPGSARRMLGRRGLALVVAVMLALLGVAAQPASGEGETIRVLLSEIDGTPAWDADDAAGHDSGPANQIVRTNDNLTYRVEVSSNGGNSDTTTITLELPKGVQFDALPPHCKTGSALTPSPMPAPTLPVTSTSWEALPVQTLACNVGTLTDGTTKTWDLVTRVRPEVPNGTRLPGISAAVTSEAVTTAVVSAPVPDVRVSARAQFDISKNGIASEPNSGWAESSFKTCKTLDDPICLYARYEILISAPPGGKGTSPLVTPITFTDDVSPAALFGAAGATAPAAYGGSLIGCSSGGIYATPRHELVDPVNSVRKSGTTACTQPGGPGTPITVTITGTDTTAYTYPTQTSNPAGLALPADRAYVYVGWIDFEMPVDAARNLGVPSGNTTTLTTTNTYTGFEPTDIGGTANLADPDWNNWRQTQYQLNDAGHWDKYFAGLPSAPGNTPPQQFMPGFPAAEGPAASLGPQSGTGQLFAGGTTTSMLFIDNAATTRNPLTTLLCDSWDNSLLQLTNVDAPVLPSPPPAQKIPALGEPVWFSSLWHTNDDVTTYATSQAEVEAKLKNLTIQYGTGVGGAGDRSVCTDDSSPAGWFDDPARVPGNDPAKLAEGIYTAVTRVRVNVTVPQLADQHTYAVLSIGLRAVDDLPSGTILPNWATGKVAFAELDLQGSLAAGLPILSTYDPSTNTGNAGDRLIAASAVGRLSKAVWDPTTAKYSTTVTPVYTAGDLVKFQLSPTLTSGITTGVTRQVVVEDCLPAGEAFVSASVPPVAAQVIAGSMPSGAGITCQVGETYVKWDLGQVAVNRPITPITYEVSVASTAEKGIYTNRALVTAQDDLSAASERDASAQIQIVQAMGVQIDKVALTPLNDVNRVGETNPDLQKWRVDMLNIGSTNPVPTDIDMIDVLPKQGLNGTAYHGTLGFVSAQATSASTTPGAVTIWYTNADIVNNDAWDPSNGSTGIAWCTAPSGGTLARGTGACPASPAEVTGLRIRQPGEFGDGDRVSVELTMLGMGNADGDVYVNEVRGRAAGLQLAVGPKLAPERIVGGSIGDLVWLDVDGDGVQDDGEAGIAGFGVSLTGTDSDGNPVPMTTTTDASGKYLFENLPAGSYTVTFDPNSLQSRQFFTTRNSGDEALDSDGDPTTGVTAPVVVGSGQAVATVDQGVTFPDLTISKEVCSTGTGCTDIGWVESMRTEPGNPVDWRITVKNPSAIDLTDVAVSDELVPSCAHLIGGLAAGASVSYTCGTEALTVSIDPNNARVIGKDPRGGDLTASDTASARILSQGGVTLVKSTNGVDANDPTGPFIVKDGVVTWTYEVTNTGTAALTDVTVTDNQVPAASIRCASGTNVIPLLAPGKSATCTAEGSATVGQYANTGSVVGQPSLPVPADGVDPDDPTTWPTDPAAYESLKGLDDQPVGTVPDDDPSHYFGAAPAIEVGKEVCAGTCDVGSDSGWVESTAVDSGDTATFRITVTNTGNITLAPVRVSDAIAPACDRLIAAIEPGESTSYTCTLGNVTTRLTNVAQVSGQGVDPEGMPVGDPVTNDDDASVTVNEELALTGVELAPLLKTAGALGLAGLVLLLVTRRRRSA